jgi:aromatic-L-amino-acid decarboxylase
MSGPNSRCTLTDHAPEKGEDFSVIARDFQEQIMPGITHWQHPSFFAYFPSITNFESILADMYATSVSNPGFNVSFLGSTQTLLG